MGIDVKKTMSVNYKNCEINILKRYHIGVKY